MATRWTVESRIYYVGHYKNGVAQLVRAERNDDCAWTRVLETIYWWPAREDKEWPAAAVPVPEWSGLGEETNAWAHFEATLEMPERPHWEPLPPEQLG